VSCSEASVEVLEKSLLGIKLLNRVVSVSSDGVLIVRHKVLQQHLYTIDGISC
jgi:hypothetical protein